MSYHVINILLSSSSLLPVVLVVGVWGEYLIEKESLIEKETLISKTKAGGQFPTQYMLVVNKVVLC